MTLVMLRCYHGIIITLNITRHNRYHETCNYGPGFITSLKWWRKRDLIIDHHPALPRPSNFLRSIMRLSLWLVESDHVTSILASNWSIMRLGEQRDRPPRSNEQLRLERSGASITDTHCRCRRDSTWHKTFTRRHLMSCLFIVRGSTWRSITVMLAAPGPGSICWSLPTHWSRTPSPTVSNPHSSIFLGRESDRFYSQAATLGSPGFFPVEIVNLVPERRVSSWLNITNTRWDASGEVRRECRGAAQILRYTCNARCYENWGV